MPLIAILISLPFGVNLIDLYLNRILPGETAFASVGAFNFQHLLWGQFSNPPQAGMLAMILLGILVFMAIRIDKRPDFWTFWKWSILLLGDVFV